VGFGFALKLQETGGCWSPYETVGHHAIWNGWR